MSRFVSRPDAAAARVLVAEAREASFGASVAAGMKAIAPLELAGSWDNVGTLLEPCVDSLGGPDPSPLRDEALLCIDLTEAVAAEAAAARCGAVVAYHPPIFRGLKKITQNVGLQRGLLRLAREGIAVYSPHTSLDTVEGGVNDILADGLPAGAREGCHPHESVQDAQVGRVVRFDAPQPLSALVAAAAAHLGLPAAAISVLHGDPQAGNDALCAAVAICAGSGDSVCSRAAGADVYLTGEMGHHEQLAAVAAGVSVILCGHTETERPYLPTLAAKLKDIGIAARVADADASPLNLAEV